MTTAPPMAPPARAARPPPVPVLPSTRRGDLVEVAEAKRQTYEAVVRDEDCATIFQIGAALPAMRDRHFVFGRNEPANQLLHRTIAEMTRPEDDR